jgi:hypothetical protein
MHQDFTGDFVTPEVCRLRHELVTTQINALADKDTALEARMERIENGIDEVRNLQKTILYAIIFVAAGVILTLAGVVLGRGIDFGWLVP